MGQVVLGAEAPEELLHCLGLQNLCNSRLQAAEDAFMSWFHMGQIMLLSMLCVGSFPSILPETM